MPVLSGVIKKMINWNDPYINKLLAFLQEITREERKTERPLYKFVELGYVNLLTSNRNHVVFGRRGSGKSALLRELETRCIGSTTYTVLIDVEQIAQKSYPNLIIEMLLVIFRRLLEKSRVGFFGKIVRKRRNLRKNIAEEIGKLQALYERADVVQQKVSQRAQTETKTQYGQEIAAIKSVLSLSANLSNRQLMENMLEEEATWQKIGELFNGVNRYRELIRQWLDEMGVEVLYLLVDDFYQIDLLHQPLITDYLKRLLRGIPCYLKMATVHHRSLLFVRSDVTEAGMQGGHDFTRLDLDFSLDNFQRAQQFLVAILHNVCEGIIGPLSPDALFEAGHLNAMDLLTEAAGGNPRDFINLLRIIISNKQLSKVITPISYSDIRSAVVYYFNDEIRTEMEKTYEKFSTMNSFLNEIVRICKDSDDIGFYLSHQDAKAFQVVSSLIGRLADSRFVHLLTQNYNPPVLNDGPAYVYILSMGLYCNYIQDIEFNLSNRQVKEKAYPRLPAAEMSDQFDKLLPELSLIGKFQD